MSKNSHKQRYAQLMEWLPTLGRQRGKRKKQQQSRLGYYEQKQTR